MGLPRVVFHEASCKVLVGPSLTGLRELSTGYRILVYLWQMQGHSASKDTQEESLQEHQDPTGLCPSTEPRPKMKSP